MRYNSFLGKVRAGAAALMVFLMTALPAQADTVFFKNGDQLKGLVVEEHEDRVVLSTFDGEIPVLRKSVQKIDFDDPAYTLLSMGRQLERSKKLGEALSYYEKAAQLNPGLEDAKVAAIGIRSRMWAGFTEGPSSEMSKQQEIEDAWRADTTLEEQAKRGDEAEESVLWKRMGLRLGQEGDFVTVSDIRIGGYAHQSGMRLADAIHSVDGRSMRYIQKRVVLRDLLNPRYASMTVEVRRTFKVPAKVGKTDLKNMGLDIKQEYQGVLIWRVKPGSPAEKLGIRTGDRLVRVGDQNTRYLPSSKIKQAFKSKQGKAFVIETGRALQMARP